MPTKMTGLLAAAGAVLAATFAVASPARAEIVYPWCAQYSDKLGGGGTNCGFVTLQQCRNTISGLGGICYENPAYPGPALRTDNIRRRR